MTKRAARIFRLMEEWTPPPGVVRTLDWHPESDYVAVCLWHESTKASAEIAIDRLDGKKLREIESTAWALTGAAKPGPQPAPAATPTAEAIEPAAPWLEIAKAAIVAARRKRPDGPRTDVLALALCHAIESDAIEAPHVSLTIGGIELYWVNPDTHRCLVVQVLGARDWRAYESIYRNGLVQDGRGWTGRDVQTGKLRRAIERVFPQSARQL